MKFNVVLLALVAGTILVAGTGASAAPSCTGWMKQNDGTHWRTCVGDNGKQYCEQAAKNGKISRVKC